MSEICRVVGSLIVACLLASAAWAGESGRIEGRVTSGESQPEAGVWVIAETDGLPTPYRKIVVTDDRGRFVVPDLPAVEYDLWVRGYGLRDSAKIAVKPGDSAELRAMRAENAKEAAAVYPGNYWLSLLELPEKSHQWASRFKLGCQLCHQVGSSVTRSLTRPLYDLGFHKASFMNLTADSLGRQLLLDALSDWSQRISAGETPPAPPRPQGVERSLVITQWGWGDSFTYAHDEVATDKRDPTRNAGGLIYGVDIGNDHLLALDPRTHEAKSVPVPTRDGFDISWCDQTYKPAAGGEPLAFGFGSLGCPTPRGATGFTGKYKNPANPHNPMMDRSGKIWMTTQIRREWAEDAPTFCNKAPEIGENYHHRQLGYYDPESSSFSLIDTCYGTHHLQFDSEGVLWLSGDTHVIGWFDPSKYDPSNPASSEKAQGWSQVVVDSDGDEKADTPIVGFHYGVIPNPLDGSIWTAIPGAFPGETPEYQGRLVRYDPKRDRHETFMPPPAGWGPRGVDVDSKGMVWAALGGSGHLARFDRSRCAQKWGTGDQCPEGWTLWRSPGPAMRGLGDLEGVGSADFHYYLWVDQFNTLGLGKDVIILNGTGSDSLLAFDPGSERFTVIRIPYPLNTFTRGLDGRIDDPEIGWKGRGLWFNNGLDPMIHSEVAQSYVGWVQLRPDPLAH